MPPSLNCSYFAVRNSFGAYAQTLLNETGGNLELVSECKLEVCGSLWGTGNNDISGIGTIVGYALDHALGFLLSTMILTQALRNHTRLERTSRACLNSFQDQALFFAFSIEIACIVVLVREDLGISTSGLGDDTVRITQAVAMLVLIALLYPIFSAVVNDSKPAHNEDAEAKIERESSRPTFSTVPSSERVKPNTEETAGQPPGRFELFVLCWALAFYPFFSKMNASFGPRKIHKPGHHQQPVLTPQQFSVIEHICLGDVPVITVKEGNLMTAFVMLAYIPLSVFVVASIIWMGVEKNHQGSKVHRKLRSWAGISTARRRMWLAVIGMVTTPLLAAGLLWSILRARQFQQHLSAAIGGGDSDEDWSFGQVVAVTVFAPLLVEGWSAWGGVKQKHNVQEQPRRSVTDTTRSFDVRSDETKYPRSLRTW